MVLPASVAGATTACCGGGTSPPISPSSTASLSAGNCLAGARREAPGLTPRTLPDLVSSGGVHEESEGLGREECSSQALV